MPMIEERFDQTKIDSLKRYLKREADKNRPKDYEIIVDGFKVVSRTDDVEEFDDYEDEIKDNPRNLSILIYDGEGTNRNTRYSFSFQDSAMPVKPMNGVGSLGEIEEIIQQRLDEKEKEHRIKELEDELEETEQKLSEAVEWHKELEAEVTKLRAEAAKKIDTRNLSITEMGTTILASLLTRSVPQLAGILGGIPAATPATQTDEPQEQATFKKKEGKEQPQLSEQQLENLRTLETMQHVLKPEHLQITFAIIRKLMSSPEQIIPAARFLNLLNEQSNA